ncbi:MAG: ParB/RepB/Spo0J family partition protein [Oscillospiraceae bacterium]|jgi:ParB family chromosome partitioning protein|nr:ParB/RepB/Spo0J family partition protein [Oscillospiraceae bacterium]
MPSEEIVVQLSLSELYPFPNHPFKVRDDEAMHGMMESVSQYGVLTPAIVRPREAGGYEIVAGHRRKHASEAAGLETIPAIIRDMDDDAAIILMVDSNIQRENILPSEKAQAYRMKLDAIKRKGARTDLTSPQAAARFRADDEVAKELGISGDTVRRYIRLTELSPQLQQMVDEKEISLTPAVELSYLKPEEQALVMEAIDSGQAVPTLTQAQQLKRASQEDGLDRAAVSSILSAGAPPSPTVRPPAQPKPPKPDKAEITEDTGHGHIAEDILRLKDTTKECRCTPEMFLSAFGEYVSRSRREMEVFLIPFYAEIFPALLPEHMDSLQRQISDIHAAADKFYNDVKGRNEHE